MKSQYGWLLACALSSTVLAVAPAAAQSPDSTKAHAAAAPAATTHPDTTKTHAAGTTGHVGSLYHTLEISPSVSTIIINSNIRVDSNDGSVGTDIDAESDLGLEKTKIQPRFAARWRPGRHHEIEGGFQFAERNADKTLNRDITFRDTTFNIGGDVHTTFNTNLLFLNYRYAIIAKDKTQAGVGLGLGAMFLKVGIDALASAGGGGISGSAESKTTAPLGSLGLYGRFLFGSRWYGEVDGRIVKLKVDRVHVRYDEFNLAGRYYLSHKTGIELGGGGDAVKVDIDPRATSSGSSFGASGQLKFSLSNVRLGFVYIP